MNIKRSVKQHVPYLFFSLSIYSLSFAAGVLAAAKMRLTIHPTEIPFFTILWHNLAIGLGMVAAGLMTFGIGNTLFLALNGAILGVTIRGVSNALGMQPIITGVVPHAAPEILAILVCSTVGYESYRIVRLIKRNAVASKKETVHIQDGLLLLGFALVLFVVAAVIEATVSRA